MSTPDISPILPSNNQIVQKEAAQALAKAVASEASLEDMYELSLFNPMVQSKKFKELEKLKSSPEKKEVEENPEEEKIMGVGGAKETAARFQRNNPELQSRTLEILRDLISSDDTPEETLQKVFSVYKDPALADEALDFLIETAPEETRDLLVQTKALLNRDYERQVKAGRNIGALARAFSEQGLGSPTALRDMYRDVTGNPRAPLQLFEELAKKYPFEKLQNVVLFLLHSLGNDLKAKGPSIPKAELSRLMTETKSLQGILGIFRFFQSRAKLIYQQFMNFSLNVPEDLSLESLARIFIRILAEKYISPEKILLTAKPLGISEEVAAQMIIYSQMHDALRQIAPRYFRNPKHRNQLIDAFVDLLEELEKELEEEKKKKKKKDS